MRNIHQSTLITLALGLALGATLGREARAQSAALAAACNPASIPAGAGTPADFRARTMKLRGAAAAGGPSVTGDVDLPGLVAALREELDKSRSALSPAESQSIERQLGRIIDIGARKTPPDFDVRGRPAKPNANGSFVLFVGMPDSIMVFDGMPDAEKRAVCFSAIEARDVISDYMLPARAALASALNARVDRWNNFHQEGYSLFVPELLLNSWVNLGRPALEPPRNQIIFLHPSVGVEAPIPFKTGVMGSDAMLLEGLGFIHYNDDRTGFFGLSAGSVFGQNERPGVAIIAHYGQFGHLGYVFRSKSSTDDSRRNTLIFSVDLLKAINAVPGSWKAESDSANKALQGCVQHLSCSP
ncbi:MAG: hypothetical protein ABJF01_21140 [bacterium]